MLLLLLAVLMKTGRRMLEQGRKDHTEAMFESDTRERNTDTATITEDVTMKQEHMRVAA
jgi:predicted acyltransferase (DUF342 family)